MTLPDPPKTSRLRNGADRERSASVNSPSVLHADIRDSGGLDATSDGDGETAECGVSRPIYLPTIDEIKSELWWIAIGDGTESSRVSALRALADIMGLMKPAPPDFPEGMTALMDALAEGLGSGSSMRSDVQER